MKYKRNTIVGQLRKPLTHCNGKARPLRVLLLQKNMASCEFLVEMPLHRLEHWSEPFNGPRILEGRYSVTDHLPTRVKNLPVRPGKKGMQGFSTTDPQCLWPLFRVGKLFLRGFAWETWKERNARVFNN